MGSPTNTELILGHCFIASMRKPYLLNEKVGGVTTRNSMVQVCGYLAQFQHLVTLMYSTPNVAQVFILMHNPAVSLDCQCMYIKVIHTM